MSEREFDITRILKNEEVQTIAEAVSAAVDDEIFALLTNCRKRIVDGIRFMAVAARCRETREARGLTVKQVAAAVKAPQHRIKAIESGGFHDLEPRVLEAYIAHLDLADWFGQWRRANPEFAARLLRLPGLPPMAEVLAISDLLAPHARAAGLLGEQPAPARPAGSAGRPMRPGQGTTQVFRLRVTLRESEPPIWRELEVPGSLSFQGLHEVVQVAMAWTDTHLYEFEVGDEVLTDLETLQDEPDKESLDARATRLWELLPGPGGTAQYRYDFGDGWEHDILIEAIEDADPAQPAPRCLGGARACPPEDCGGVSGYEDLLRALRNPGHKDHVSLKEWLGRPFDPEAFDLDEVNAVLKHFRPRRRR